MTTYLVEISWDTGEQWRQVANPLTINLIIALCVEGLKTGQILDFHVTKTG